MADISPTFRDLTPQQYLDVNVGSWYFAQNIALVPDTVAPFLAAHGFIVNGGTEHYIAGEFAGYLLNMYRNKFSRLDAMQILLDTMVDSFNEGRTLNQTRYEDLVSNLSDLLSTNQAEITDFLNNNVTDSTGYVTLLISNLALLQSDFTSHNTTASAYLTNLGIAQEALINEKYDNQLTSQNQALINRGWYSSPMWSQVVLQIERDRTTELIQWRDQLAREQLDNEHKLYEQEFRMRLEDLRVRQSVGGFHADLIKYQLDQRSNLALALFGLVERREDDYASLGDMAATISALGDDQ